MRKAQYRAKRHRSAVRKSGFYKIIRRNGTASNVFPVENIMLPSKGSFMNAKRTSALCTLALALLIPVLTLRAEPTNDVPPPEKKKLFIFEGGNPIEFVLALDRHFRTRLVQILTLPEMLRKTQVPKLRVAAEDPREVLSLYNRLDSPMLGQWRYEPSDAPRNGPGTGTNMNVLMLVPDKNVITAKSAPSVIKVKALALAGVPESKWEALAADIEVARRTGEDLTQGASDTYKGTSRFQKESKVLIISGSEPFIETVESVIDAYRTNLQLESKAAANSEAASAPTK